MKNLAKEARELSRHAFKNWKVTDDPGRKMEQKLRGYQSESIEYYLTKKVGKQNREYTKRSV